MARLGPTLFELMLQKNQQDYARQQQQDEINYQRQMDANNMLANAAKLQSARDDQQRQYGLGIAKLYGQAAGEGQDRPQMNDPQAEEYAQATEAATRGSQVAEGQKLAAQYGWHANQLAEQSQRDAANQALAQAKLLQNLGIANMNEAGRNQRAGDNIAETQNKEAETKRWHDMLLAMAGMKAQQQNNSPNKDWDLRLGQMFQSEPGYKDMQKVASQNSIIQRAPSTGPGHLAMLTAFMRMTDPQTGVRPSEMREAESVGNLYQQAEGWAARLSSGQAQRLPPEIEKLFRDASKQMVQSYAMRYKGLTDKYTQRSLAKGGDPEWVVGNDPDITAALQGLGQPPQTSQRTTRADGKVLMLGPDGKKAWVDPDGVDDAKAHGWSE